jgi:hypothetical protein
MSKELSKIEQLVKLLNDAGFTDGFACTENELLLWEHDDDPPKPLTRPA